MDINIEKDFTLAEWCAKRRISRGTFYNLQKRGLAPRAINAGKRVIITRGADLSWEAEMQERAAGAVAARSVEREAA